MLSAARSFQVPVRPGCGSAAPEHFGTSGHGSRTSLQAKPLSLFLRTQHVRNRARESTKMHADFSASWTKPVPLGVAHLDAAKRLWPRAMLHLGGPQALQRAARGCGHLSDERLRPGWGLAVAQLPSKVPKSDRSGGLPVYPASHVSQQEPGIGSNPHPNHQSKTPTKGDLDHPKTQKKRTCQTNLEKM